MIITATTLVLVIGILAYSNNLFNTQTENGEFAQAQTAMTNLADYVESVATRQGSSAYVTFSTRSGGPAWNPSIDSISVTVNIKGQANNITNGVQGNYTVFSGIVNQLLFKAGSAVGTTSLNTVQGKNAPFVLNNNASMGWVYTNQSNGAVVGLNFDRVGIVDLGYLNVTSGSSASPAFNYIHLIQVTFINFTFGNVTGGARNVVVTNTGLSVISEPLYFSGNPTNPYYLYVNVSQSSGSTQVANMTISPGAVTDNISGYVPVNVVIEVVSVTIRIDFVG